MAATLVLNPQLDMRALAQTRRRWFALGVIVVAQLLIVLDATVVTIALPTAQQALHISQANRQWVLTAYTIAFGGLLLLGGRIADYTGRKRAFIVGLIGLAAASALAGAAVNQGMLYGSRALQGAFAAVMAPAALSLLTVAFTHPRERALAFGLFGAVSGGGSAVGLLIGRSPPMDRLVSLQAWFRGGRLGVLCKRLVSPSGVPARAHWPQTFTCLGYPDAGTARPPPY